MKNSAEWRPGKFVLKNGILRGSRDRNEVRLGSRLVTDIVARHYDLYLKNYARGRLIDLGCGRVPLYASYKDRVEAATCVDWANSPHRSIHLDYECNLMEELPFEDGQFDTIILSDVLEHLPEPGKIWQEMARILAPGGTLLLSTPFYYCLHEMPHDYFRYTEYALRWYAREQGLEVLLLKPLGGTPEVLADILGKHLEVIPVLGGLLANTAQGLVSLFIRTRTGMRVSSLTAKHFPLGYFMVARKRDRSTTPFLATRGSPFRNSGLDRTTQ